MSKLQTMNRLARLLEIEHRRIELDHGACAAKLCALRDRQQSVAQERARAHEAVPITEHAALMGWRSAHMYILAVEARRVEAQQQHLGHALSEHAARLALSTGRRQTLQRLTVSAESEQHRDAQRLRQAENDQRLGWSCRQRDTLR